MSEKTENAVVGKYHYRPSACTGQASVLFARSLGHGGCRFQLKLRARCREYKPQFSGRRGRLWPHCHNGLTTGEIIVLNIKGRQTRSESRAFEVGSRDGGLSTFSDSDAAQKDTRRRAARPGPPDEPGWLCSSVGL